MTLAVKTKSPVAGQEDRKRRQIVDAAITLFLKDGFAGVSMENVADLAGVSKATIYTRFKSKEELFDEVVTESCGGAPEPKLSGPPEEISLEEALMAVGQTGLARVMKPRTIAVLRIALGASAQFPHVPKILWNAGPALGQKFIHQMLEIHKQRTGKLKGKDLEALSTQFINRIFGPYLFAVLLGVQPIPKKTDMERDLKQTVRNFMTDIGA